MTQSGNEAAGDLGEAGRETSVTESAPWAPFRNRAFRWLWIGVLISWTGTWMQTLGAQWLVVDQPNAAALVSLRDKRAVLRLTPEVLGMLASPICAPPSSPERCP